MRFAKMADENTKDQSQSDPHDGKRVANVVQ
jgi:hypothetical protein